MPHRFTHFCFVLLIVALASWSQADPPVERPAPVDLSRLRRIYVPYEALNAVLKAADFKGILTPQDFDKLLERARNAQAAPPLGPEAPVVSAATYHARLDGERLLADVDVHIAAGRPHAEVDLNIAGWNVEGGTLNEQPAWLARAGKDFNQLRVFLPTAGTQVLTLRLSCPVRAAGSDQLAAFELVGAASERFLITLDPEKSLQVNGLNVGQRDPRSAEFEIPVGGLQRLELAVTDRARVSQREMLTFASTAYGIHVVPGEVTWTARTELQVFGQSIDRLICRVPRTLEITSVESEGLEAWDLSNDPAAPEQTTITLRYRQAFDGSRTISLSGILSTAADSWNVPGLTIANVTTHSGVVLVQHPHNVRLQTVQVRGARPVPAPPPAATSADQYFEVWQENFELRFAVALKEQSVQAAMTNLLFVNDQGLELSTTVSLQSRLAPLFEARLRLPAEYRVNSATVDGRPVDWQTVADVAGINEIRIPLEPPAPPGKMRTVALVSQFQPQPWPVDQVPVRVPIPEVRLPQADMVEALYGISASDDLEVVPLELTGLDPAARGEIESLNSRLPASGQQVRLGFTYQDTVFSGQLEISRRPSLLTAETLTFFRVNRETVFTRLEARLSFTGGGRRELNVQTSAAAGDRLRFSLAPGAAGSLPARLVEQTPGEKANGLRSWRLSFDRYLHGEVVLWTEIELPRGDASEFSPVRLSFPEANAQSGFIAVEGAPDEQVRMTAVDADGQPLAAVDPVDFPQGFYQPQMRVVAGYSYALPGWTLNVSTTQFDRAAIPSAIGHLLEIESIWGPAGALQHQVRLSFTAFGMQHLLARLPEGAQLWSTLLDGQPVPARRQDKGIQLPLGGLSPEPHTLELVYATAAPPQSTLGELRATPPQVSVVSGAGTQQPLEILQQRWELHYPRETLLVSSDGEFRPVRQLPNETWVGHIRSMLRLPTADSLWLAALTLLLTWGVILLLGWTWQATAARGCSMALLGTLALLAIISVVTVALLLPGVQNARHIAWHGRPPVGIMFDAEMDQAQRISDSLAVVPEVHGEIPPSAPVIAPQEPEQAAHPAILGRDKQQVDRLLRRERLADTPPPAPARDGAAQKREQAGAAAAPFGSPSSAFGTIPSENAPVQQWKFDPNSPAINAVDTRLGLQVQQSQTIDNQRRGSGAANGQAGFNLSLAQSAGGLLSITIGWQPPEGSRSQTFEYQGNDGPVREVDLRVRYANRGSGRILVWSMALGIGLLGWWLRRASARVRMVWIFLTLAVPVGLLGIVPVLWQVVCEGVLYGGLGSLLGWALLSCGHCCERSCGNVRTSRGGLGLMLLLLGTLTADAHSAAAEEKPAPAPATADPYVVIPYRSLEDLSSADRVWVPSALFKQLWQAAHPEEAEPPAASIASTMAAAHYAARLQPREGGGAEVTVQARWVAVNFTSAPQQVALPMTGGAPQEILLDGAAAAAVVSPKGGVAVVLPGRGVHVVDARIVLPATVNRSVGRFEVPCLPVASGTLTFELPESEEPLVIRVNGSSGAYRRIAGPPADRVEIPIDRGGLVKVSWQPEQQKSDAANLVQLETAVAVVVGDAGVQFNHACRLRVRQGAWSDMVFDVQAGQAIREISGADVAGWEIHPQGDVKQVRVLFRRSITDQTQFQIELFESRPLGDMTQTLPLRTLVPSGLSSEVVQVAVYAPEHLQLRVQERQGAQQLDIAQFRPDFEPRHPAAPPQFVFRISARPVTLALDVSRREAEARGTIEHAVQVGRRKTVIASRVLLQLSGAPRRLVNFVLPEGYLPVDVVCPQMADWSVSTEAGVQQLTIELDQPRLGEVEVGLEGHLVRNPADETVALQVPYPLQASRETIALGVWFDETYQPSLSQTGNWKSIPASELPSSIRELKRRPVQFAFRTAGSPEPLRFQVTRAVPELTADAAILIAAGDATVDYGLTIRWNIANAAADLFAFTAPDWLGQIEVTGTGIRQVQSADAGNGLRRWTVSLIDPARGEFVLTAAATTALTAEKIIRTPQLEIQSVGPAGQYAPLETQRQFAAIVNLSGSQLTPSDPAQIDAISADQLPLALPPSLVQQAVTIVRVRPGKVPSWLQQRLPAAASTRAIVVAANLTTVLQMDGSWRTRAIYAVRNRGQQFLTLHLPDGAQVLSVFVRGEPSRTVVTTVNGKEIQLVALPQTSEADLSFDVILMLAGNLEQRLPRGVSLRNQSISLPAPQVVTQEESAELGLPVAQTLWSVFVPEELDVSPLESGRASNLTWHRGRGWLTSEMQTLERLKSDLAEMKRIASDSQASHSRRSQARENLRQLDALLQSEQTLAAAKDARHDVYRRYLAENERAQQEARAAVKELSDLNRSESGEPQVKGEALVGSGPTSGRAFIHLGNTAILNANSGQLNSTLEDHVLGENLNFFKADDARRAAAKAKTSGADGAARMLLKEQLQQQAPANPIPALEKKAASEMGGLGGTGSDRMGRGDRNDNGTTPWQDGLLFGGVVAQPAGKPSQGPAGSPAEPAIWSAAGGISVAMTLPETGQQLSFSKVGGNPRLVLSVRAKQTWALVLGGGWCLVCLWLGVWIMRSAGMPAAAGRLPQVLALGAMLVGVAGFLLLPGGIRWGCFALFCAGGLLHHLLAALESRRTHAGPSAVSQ